MTFNETTKNSASIEIWPETNRGASQIVSPGMG